MSAKSIKMNMIFNLIRTVSGIVFPLISFPYTSRILGPHGTGWMNFAISFAGYFTMFATIGIPAIGIRAIAQARDDLEELGARAQELFLMHLGASVLAFIVYLSVVILRPDLNNEALLFTITGVSILLSMLGVDWIYQGLEEYRYIAIRSVVFSTVSLVSLFVFVHDPDDYVICAAISVASSLGSSLLNFYTARRHLLRPRTRPWNFRRHLRAMGSSWALNLVSSLYLSLDTVMLGFLSKPENVGYYAAASRFFTLTWAMIASFGTTLLPRLSYYSETGNEEGFRVMIGKSFAMTFMLCVPAIFALMLLSNDIILVFAGDKFLPAVACLNITVPGLFFASVANILAWQILFPKKQESKVLRAASIAAVVSVTSNLILIRMYAHIGAAVSKVVSEIVVTIALYFLARRVCVFDMFPWKTIRFYLLAAFAMLGALVLVRLAVPVGLFRLAVSVPVGVVVYFGVLVLLKDELAEVAVDAMRKKMRLGPRS
jgi:O-antigen/teichoic acid export membrane protein